MKAELISKIKKGRQDGAIFGGFLFSFNGKGICTVYEIKKLKNEAEAVAEFVLDKAEFIIPHSNSVVFGCEYFDENDEFPLLYSNIYNNYAKEEDKKLGTCLVYRLQRQDKMFKTTLVQTIEIGFTDNADYWKSSWEAGDVRPYGNFVIDREKGKYYAFTMRDEANATRVFEFDLPRLSDGEKVVLETCDIKGYFDVEYQRYIQGACLHDDKIYSLEGFSATSLLNKPLLRIIDTNSKTAEVIKLSEDYGLDIEPEMIDFDGETCYFCNHYGDLYKLEF